MNIFAALGLLLLIGYLGGRFANRINLPRVSGYLFLGVLLSPSLLNLITNEHIRAFSLIPDFILFIIAFTIGGGLKMRELKGLQKSIFYITAFEASFAFIMVTAGLYPVLRYILKIDDPFITALFFGAIASATAPAATIAVIREYRAKGPLTQTLLGVVALDDAAALINYSIALSLAYMIKTESSAVFRMLAEPIKDIFLALALGLLAGFLLSRGLSAVKTRYGYLTVIVGTITLLGGIANHLGTSPLLANMALGFYMTNDLRVPRTAFNVIDEIEPTLFVVFFTLAGAHLELRNLLHGTLIIFLYIILRLLGKAIGVMTGGAASNAPKTVRKYLALGLAPQAGVAIGLALLLNQEAHFSGQGRFIIDVIIGSTVIYELTGPLLAKLALTKAGEVKENA